MTGFLCGAKHLQGIEELCDGDPTKGIPCACTRAGQAGSLLDSELLTKPRRLEIDGIIIEGPPS
jgi:hypothetical protein